MMIETTMMRYGHGPTGMSGITFNQEALQRWALSIPVSSQLQKNFLNLKDTDRVNIAMSHKEEGPSRIKSDGEDRKHIREMLNTCISPLRPDEHLKNEIVNVVTGKLSSATVNVDKAHELGCKLVTRFTNELPDGFYKPLSKVVVTMAINKKSIKVGDVHVYDTDLIYSRVIALQLSRESVTMHDILKHELSPVPTSMFTDAGDIRISKSKSVLKNKLCVEMLSRLQPTSDIVIIDGSAVLWTVQWQSNGTVADFLSSFVTYITRKLMVSHVCLVFDRYYDYSIKSFTRAERGKAASRHHKITSRTTLGPKIVMLGNTNNKRQLIDAICEKLIQHTKESDISKMLILTGKDEFPTQVMCGMVTRNTDLRTTHEEADVIIVHQFIYAATVFNYQNITVISEVTDIFVLLVYYFWKYDMKCKVLMEGTRPERKLIDIGETAVKHRNVVPNLVAAHAITGCDTVAHCQGIGKATVLKKLEKGLELDCIGKASVSINEVLRQSTILISSCYGHVSEDMTATRVKIWSEKTAKSRSCAPKLQTLPPTTEAFAENVKRGHFQAIIWYSAPNNDPPLLDPTHYGWTRDEKEKSLVPIGIPPNVPSAPEQIINLIRCNCRSTRRCDSNRCSCSAVKLSCTMLCHCQGKKAICFNVHTNENEELSSEEEEDNEADVL